MSDFLICIGRLVKQIAYYMFFYCWTLSIKPGLLIFFVRKKIRRNLSLSILPDSRIAEIRPRSSLLLYHHTTLSFCLEFTLPNRASKPVHSRKRIDSSRIFGIYQKCNFLIDSIGIFCYLYYAKTHLKMNYRL